MLSTPSWMATNSSVHSVLTNSCADLSTPNHLNLLIRRCRSAFGNPKTIWLRYYILLHRDLQHGSDNVEFTDVTAPYAYIMNVRDLLTFLCQRHYNEMTSQFQVRKRKQDLFLLERQFTSLHEEHLKQYITFQLQIKSYVRSIKTYLLAKFHDFIRAACGMLL